MHASAASPVRAEAFGVGVPHRWPTIMPLGRAQFALEAQSEAGCLLHLSASGLNEIGKTESRDKCFVQRLDFYLRGPFRRILIPQKHIYGKNKHWY